MESTGSHYQLKPVKESYSLLRLNRGHLMTVLDMVLDPTGQHRTALRATVDKIVQHFAVSVPATLALIADPNTNLKSFSRARIFSVHTRDLISDLSKAKTPDAEIFTQPLKQLQRNQPNELIPDEIARLEIAAALMVFNAIEKYAAPQPEKVLKNPASLGPRSMTALAYAVKLS